MEWDEMEGEGSEELDWDEEWERCNISWQDDIVTSSLQYDKFNLTDG